MQKRTMKIATVSLDASYSDVYKVGAYAFWIACDNRRITKADLFKSIDNNNQAEIMALANALVALLKSDFRGITGVIINIDAIGIKNKISGMAGKGSVARFIYDTLEKIRIKYHISKSQWWEIRHVNSHEAKRNLSVRQYVHAWCDKTARQLVREKVKQLTKEQASSGNK